jgi:hypothetical protein
LGLFTFEEKQAHPDRDDALRMGPFALLMLQRYFFFARWVAVESQRGEHDIVLGRGEADCGWLLNASSQARNDRCSKIERITFQSRHIFTFSSWINVADWILLHGEGFEKIWQIGLKK